VKSSMRMFIRPLGGMAALAVTSLIIATGSLSFTLTTDAAIAAPLGTITEFNVGLNPESSPTSIATGPEGNLWFTDDGTTKAIGRITPSGTITEFTAGLNETSWVASIVAGPDGNLWFTDRGAVGRITPAGVITEFSAGVNPGSKPEGLVTGPDGNLWFADDGSTRAIGRITLSATITEFTAGLSPSSEPFDIVAGPDGNLWFTDAGLPAVGRVTPSGTITEFSSGLNTGSEPSGIAPGADGNLWFIDDGSTKAVGRVTPSGTITEFGSGLEEDTCPHFFCGLGTMIAGPDGNMWFPRTFLGTIDRITPSGVITEFSAGLPVAGGPQDLAPGPDGNVWFVEARSPTAIGRITPSGMITEFGTGLKACSDGGEVANLAAGPGASMWFTDCGSIGRITTTEAASPAAQPPATTGGSSTLTTTVPYAASVTPIGTHILTKKSGETAIKLACAGTGICRGKLTLTIMGKDSRKGKGKRSNALTIATATFAIPAGQTATIKLQLNTTGRLRLRADHGRLGATLTILKSSPSPVQTHTGSIDLVQMTTNVKKSKK
jgi:streptogramin lyase